MLYFSALIYDGYRQKLVEYQCRNESELDSYLSSTYPLHVCLWRGLSDKQPNLSQVLMNKQSETA